MMQRGLQIIKLPSPKNLSIEEKTVYDKQSEWINQNFKTIFDGVDELKTAVTSQEQLNATLAQVQESLTEINRKLDELNGGR